MDDLLILLPLLLFALLFIEIIVSSCWVPVYFKTGIPLFTKSFQFTKGPSLSADDFSKTFNRTIVPPVIFRKFSNSEIGFREKAFCFRPIIYAPVMRGLIRIDNIQRKTTITGYVNWFYVCLVAILIITSFFDPWKPADLVISLVFLLPVLGIHYLIQFVLFRKVFKHLKKGQYTTALKVEDEILSKQYLGRDRGYPHGPQSRPYQGAVNNK